MAIRFFVGRTYERIVNHTDPQDRLRRVYKVVGRDTEDDSVEFIHFHDFHFKPDAEDLLERIEEAEVDREHLESSEHWEKAPRDTRSHSQRMQDQAYAERHHRQHQRLVRR